jgi:hypothetical protein
MWEHAGTPHRDTFGDNALLERTGSGGAPRASSASLFRPAVPCPDDRGGTEELTRLHQGLDVFRHANSDSVQSAQRVLSPLLDLWSLAAAVDHATAAPIETLLSALVVRTTTTSVELLACVDAVEATLTRFSVSGVPPNVR